MLNYANIDNNKYAYKFEGLESNWNYQDENYIRFSRLPYGEFNLRIKGRSSKSSWSTQELVIPIIVVQPFYTQSWFIFLVILSILIVALFVYLWRVKSLEARSKELESIVKERTQKIESDKKLIEQQAKKLLSLDKLKSRLFANITHELKTPLTLILGPISSILKNKTLSDRDTKMLSMAQENGKSLKDLIESILDLSRIEEGNMALELKEISVYKTLLEIYSMFESHAAYRHIDLYYNYTMEYDLCAELDEEKFKTIVTNLITNALKFTNDSGKVMLNVLNEKDNLIISVKDTGKGISKEDLPYIFDRYYQGGSNKDPLLGGTGIGLALCKEYVDLMSGNISVESELGAGSEFKITIPLKRYSQREIKIDRMSDQFEVDIIPREKENEDLPRILVVEDNQSLQLYLQRILQDKFDLTIVGDGKIALEHLKKDANFDLIISDIMMPVMDGYQLLELVKSEDKWRHLPIIMLTARDGINDKLKALTLGVDDYLKKPFVEEELIARMENLIQNRVNRSIDEKSASLSEVKVSKEDQEWIMRYETFVAKNLKNDLLSVSWLASEFAMSESSLLRQLKRITGLTPIKYVREHKLNYARRLLEEKSYNSIASVAYEAGFKDTRNFSKSFKSRFGISPSELIKNQ